MTTGKFNSSEHLMQIKSRNGASDYLPIQWRLVWFRLECPDGTIETEIVHLDLDRETEEEAYQWNSETRKSEKVIKRAPGFAVFRAIVKDGRGGVAMGTKSEKAASFGDFIEKAETGAIGRALAALGYGTQFTGDEFDERHRIVDAPVEAKQDVPAEKSHEKKTAQGANTSDKQEGFRPLGAAEQALQRIATKCNEIAGPEKGPKVYARIHKHALEKLHLGDVADKDVPDAVLTDMWNMLRDAERNALAKAS